MDSRVMFASLAMLGLALCAVPAASAAMVVAGGQCWSMNIDDYSQLEDSIDSIEVYVSGKTVLVRQALLTECGRPPDPDLLWNDAGITVIAGPITRTVEAPGPPAPISEVELGVLSGADLVRVRVETQA